MSGSRRQRVLIQEVTQTRAVRPRERAAPPPSAVEARLRGAGEDMPAEGVEAARLAAEKEFATAFERAGSCSEAEFDRAFGIVGPESTEAGPGVVAAATDRREPDLIAYDEAFGERPDACAMEAIRSRDGTVTEVEFDALFSSSRKTRK